MVTFTCPQCGQARTYAVRRCYECTKVILSPESRAKQAAAIRGSHHTGEARERMSEVHKRLYREGQVPKVNLADLMRGKRSPRALPIGSTKVQNGHMTIKTAEGQRRWPYRARVVWEGVHGPIPKGRLIHHKNEEPFDDRIENLQMVTRAEHAKIHAGYETMRERGRKGLAARGYTLT